VGRQVLRFAPPILSGHGLDARDQVVLGAMTLAELHKKLGDSVTLDNGYRRQRLVIVGTATMPSMGSGGPDDLEMGSGALVATSDFSVAALNVQEDPIPGPNAVLVRIRPGSNPSAAYGSLVQVNNAVNALPDDDQPAGGVISCYGRPRSSTTGRWEQFLPTSVWDWLWERSSPSVSRWRLRCGDGVAILPC